MNHVNRNRALWLLVALVSIHTLVTTAIFLGTGTLPDGLMVLTLVVFGTCAGWAIYAMASMPRRAMRRMRPESLEIPLEEPTPSTETAVRIQVKEGPRDPPPAPTGTDDAAKPL